MQESYINSKQHAYKIAKYVGEKLSKIYETEHSARLREESELRLQKREIILEGFKKRETARRLLSHFNLETEDLNIDLDKIISENRLQKRQIVSSLSELARHKNPKDRVKVFVSDGRSYNRIVREGLNIALLFSYLKSSNKETNSLIEDQWVFKSLGINRIIA